jgi:hypothetical protein
MRFAFVKERCCNILVDVYAGLLMSPLQASGLGETVL